MFVEFKYIRFKNILSYGAKWTQIDFKSGMNLVSGPNGAGKTTFMDATSYCLYGKPYRKITLGELLNRSNKKGLETEIFFKVCEDEYKIYRSMKPDKLELYKNNEKQESLSSKNLSQQDIIKIIGIDYKMFKQIMALAISYNVPFLTMEASEKRDIIESIFNIKVFGRMMKGLKERVSDEKVKYEISKKSVDMMEDNLKTLRRNLFEMKNAVAFFNAVKESDIKMYEDKIEKCNKNIADLEQEILVDVERLKKFNEELSVISTTISSIELEISKIEKPDILKIPEYIKLIDEISTHDKDIEKYNNIVVFDNEEIKKEQNELRTLEFLLKSTENSKPTSPEIEKIRSKIEELKKSEDILTDDEIHNINDLESNSKHVSESILVIKLKMKDVLDEINKLTSDHTALTLNNISRKNSIKSKNEDIEYLKNNNVCQKCKHIITDEYRNAEIENIYSEIKVLENEIASVNSEEITNKIASNKQFISQSEEEIEKLEYENKDITSKIIRYKESCIATHRSERMKETSELEKVSIGIFNTMETEFNNKIFSIKTSINMQNSKMLSMIDSAKNNINITISEIKNLKSAALIKAESIKNEAENNYNLVVNKLKSDALSAGMTKRNIESNINNINSIINAKKHNISGINDNLKMYITQLDEKKNSKPPFEIEKFEKEFEDKVAEFKSVYSSLASSAEKLELYKIVSSILSDDGIKTYFFKKLTPILNMKINEYIAKFDIPVMVNFNELMEETIININDPSYPVSYFAYSEGEKKSIDTAILMSFIDITKAVCNWNCNILMIDELIDGQVDMNRLRKMLECIKQLFAQNGLSVYIVSHKINDEMINQFDNIISISKIDGYSEISI